MTPGTEQRKLAAIMFTDMVGYSALAQKNEPVALELLEEHRRLLRSLFPRFNGTEIKTIGDAFLVEFGSALEAAQCAIEIQRALAKRNADVAAASKIQVRIGIHIGDVIHREGDVLGDGVNIASRIEPLAGAGGICISMDVERQIRHALEASLVKLPAAELKNIQVPMDLFRIVLPWEKGAEESRKQKTESGKQSSAAARSRWTIAVVALAVVVVVGVGWWLTQRSSRDRQAVALPQTNLVITAASNAPTRAPDQKSVAVLPFVNVSGDKADEPLSDGITDELISTLQPVLQVKGRASSFYFKGKNERLQKIGQDLQVKYLVEGTVSKAGNKLRITVDLVTAADESQLWATNYDRPLDDLLAIRTDVATRVAEALKGKLLSEERQQLAKRGTANPEAYWLYVQGRYHWAKYSLDGWTKALAYFDQAIAKDPNYALAYAGKADAYHWLASGLPSKEAWANGKAAALKALELDDTLAEAHSAVALSRFYNWDWAAVDREYRQAIQLNPNLAFVRDGYANFLLTRGRFDEALREQQQALEPDPFSNFLNVNLGWVYYESRQYDRAIGHLRKALELDPNYAESHRLLGWCLLEKGQTGEALAEMLKMKSLDDSPWNGASLAYVYGASGDTNAALRIMREWDTASPPRHVLPGSRIIVYSGVGDTGSALTWLVQAYEVKDSWCPWFNVESNHKAGPLYKFRSHPRFQALVKKIENGGRDP